MKQKYLYILPIFSIILFSLNLSSCFQLNAQTTVDNLEFKDFPDTVGNNDNYTVDIEYRTVGASDIVIMLLNIDDNSVAAQTTIQSLAGIERTASLDLIPYGSLKQGNDYTIEYYITSIGGTYNQRTSDGYGPDFSVSGTVSTPTANVYNVILDDNNPERLPQALSYDVALTYQVGGASTLVVEMSNQKNIIASQELRIIRASTKSTTVTLELDQEPSLIEDYSFRVYFKEDDDNGVTSDLFRLYKVFASESGNTSDEGILFSNNQIDYSFEKDPYNSLEIIISFNITYKTKISRELVLNLFNDSGASVSEKVITIPQGENRTTITLDPMGLEDFNSRYYYTAQLSIRPIGASHSNAIAKDVMEDIFLDDIIEDKSKIIDYYNTNKENVFEVSYGYGSNEIYLYSNIGDVEANHVLMYNVLGNVVRDISDFNNYIDINDLQTGIYYIRIFYMNTSETKKLILKGNINPIYY